MKKAILPFALLLSICVASCHKDHDGGSNNNGDMLTTEKEVNQNFGQDIAFATYTDLVTAGNTLNASVDTFVAHPSDANLETAKTAWRNMRALWEQSEGFLFGPVEDNNYDPVTDTWPTDLNEMDSLLSDESNSLDLPSIQLLPYSLRGYHPLEYMLWGANSNKTLPEFTPRQKTYMESLALDISNQVTANLQAWASGYLTQVLTAGQGSSEFQTFYKLYYTMNEGMIGICNEVGKSDEGTGKIWEPFSANNNQGDSTLVESPYSENSMTDFKNNIQGAYNVYLGKYKTTGTSLSDLVQMSNKSLDAEIKNKFDAAISSFDGVNISFEKAIYSERDQLQNIINAIGAVRDELDEKLGDFLLKNVTN